MAILWVCKWIVLSSTLIVLVIPNIIDSQLLSDYSINECRNVPDGTYALRNLSEYMVCVNSSAVYRSCQLPNQVYQPSTNSCVPLSNIKKETFCDDRPTGDWAYPWDCHKYIHCYFNWQKVYSCENGSIYDAVTDSCVDISLKRNDTICVMPNTSDSNITTNSSGNATTTNENSGTPNGNITSSSNSSTLTTDDTKSDLISLAEVQQRLSSKDIKAIILIDVRMPWELKTEGKIGVSHNIPLPYLEKALQMDDVAFKQKYGFEKPAKDNCNLVFHCKSGVRSQRAVDSAKELGYTCSKSMDGGFDAWKKIYLK